VAHSKKASRIQSGPKADDHFCVDRLGAEVMPKYLACVFVALAPSLTLANDGQRNHATGNAANDKSSAAREYRRWTFDRDPAGKPPPGWTFAHTNPAEGKARWTVEKDPGAPSAPNILTLHAASGPRAFNLAIADDTHEADVDLSVCLRANSGKEDQGGGLIWRCTDPDNYYICRINPLESNFRVYHVVKGKRTQLAGVDAKLNAGKWCVVRVKMIGDHIQCFLDGQKLLDCHDKTITAPGRVGLWTKADASSSFDNIAVRKAAPAKSDNAPVADPGAPAKRDPDGDDDD